MEVYRNKAMNMWAAFSDCTFCETCRKVICVTSDQKILLLICRTQWGEDTWKWASLSPEKGLPKSGERAKSRRYFCAFEEEKKLWRSDQVYGILKWLSPGSISQSKQILVSAIPGLTLLFDLSRPLTELLKLFSSMFCKYLWGKL